MSEKTWIAEFYPVPACDCVKGEGRANSLRKWEGYTPENLERHALRNPPDLGGSSSSCALCVQYQRHYLKRCSVCPLAASRGGVPCDATKVGEHESPWFAWIREDNPHP